jgi:hypothetical protein
MSFEEHLLNGIPQAEAAEYFLRIRGRDKVAVDAAAFEAAIAGLPEGERAELLKSASAVVSGVPLPGKLKKANMGMMPQAPLPPTGKGQNMSPATPAPLPPTGMGQNAVKIGAAEKSQEETGKERATAASAAHFEKEKHHSHERNRELIGHLGGAAIGAAVGHHMKGNATSKVLATLAGGHIGGQAGRHSGQEQDARDWKKKHGEAFKVALDAMGLTTDGGKPQQMAQQPPEEPGPDQMQTPGAPQGVEPRIPPAVQAFLDAQQQGDQAAEMSHADFLRGKLEEARAAQQAAEEQAAALQEQQAAHEQAQAEIQMQVQQSVDAASAAQDQVLQEQQAAAAMRMAYQQLRGQVLQIASNDPPALSSDAAALSAASTAAAPQSGPEAKGPAEAGPAGKAPSPGTPNTPAPEGEETVTDKIEPNEPTFGNAEPTTSMSQKEPQGDAKTPQKEVLSHYRPLDLRKLLP